MTDNLTKTKEAMKAAPRGAFYVWPDRALFAPNQIAKDVSRSDLTIVSPNFFGRKGRGYGLRAKIVIDPNCVLSVAKLMAIDRCNILEKKP